MIRSMTGYGRGENTLNGRDITVEIRSVNHRFFEYSSKLPRSCNFMEDKFKKLLQEKISRGKVEVSVMLASTAEDDSTAVTINKELAREYVEQLRELGKELDLKDDLSLTSVCRFGDIFCVSRRPDDEEQLWQDISSVTETALASFIAMREREGESLKKDILSRLKIIEDDVAIVEKRSPETVKEYREKLMAKLKEILEGSTIDESRVLQEVAMIGEKLAVDEETVRLRSHISQIRGILDSDEPVGRRLDFLVQELNREANTIGSKAQDMEIASVVVDIKSNIEKVREQIQNLE